MEVATYSKGIGFRGIRRLCGKCQKVNKKREDQLMGGLGMF